VSTEPIALEEIQAGGCGGGALDKIWAAGMRRPSIGLATVTKQWLDHDRADVPQREPASVSIFPNDVDHFSCSPIPSMVNFTSSDHQAFAAGANSDMEASPQLHIQYHLDESQQAQLRSQILVYGAIL
jgi:hypothetical protein